MFTVGAHVPATFIAGQSRTLADMFARRVARHPDVNAFFDKRDGRWVGTTWRDWERQASQVAAGLADLGIEAGDRVAILGPTRAPWAVQDMGAQMAGCVSLGIYPHQAPDQIRYLLEHSDAKVVFVADAAELSSVLDAAQGLETLRAIVPWTREVAAAFAGRDPRVLGPDRFEGAQLDPVVRAARLAARGSDDTAIFVYTSGTTGPPKCAAISHGNILSLLGSQADLGQFFEDDVSLSFLPMAHVAERVLAFYGRINAGMATAYATSTGAVLDELREVRPTIFGSVPRIFEKAYGRVRTEVARKSPAVRALFAWAERVGKARVAHELAGAVGAARDPGAARGGRPTRVPQDPGGLRRAGAAVHHGRRADAPGGARVLLGRRAADLRVLRDDRVHRGQPHQRARRDAPGHGGAPAAGARAAHRRGR